MRVLVVLLTFFGFALRPADHDAHAQSTSGGIDQPTQRFIPFPEGNPAELSRQAQLLQQLRELVVSSPEQPTLPTLSDEQLERMEKAFESWRKEVGDEQLPDLSSIPPEWIQAAVPDPQQRRQAEELLERYARERNLPIPPNGSTPSQAGVRIPNDASPNRLNTPATSAPRSRTSSESPQRDKTAANSGGTASGQQPTNSQHGSSSQSSTSQAAERNNGMATPGVTERSGNPATPNQPGVPQPGGVQQRGVPGTNSTFPNSPPSTRQLPSGNQSNGTASPIVSGMDTPAANQASPGTGSIPTTASASEDSAAKPGTLPPMEELDPQRIEALKKLFSQLTAEANARQSANAQSQNRTSPSLATSNGESPLPGLRYPPEMNSSPGLNSPANRNSNDITGMRPSEPRPASGRRSAPSISQLSESPRFRPSQPRSTVENSASASENSSEAPLSSSAASERFSPRPSASQGNAAGARDTGRGVQAGINEAGQAQANASEPTVDSKPAPSGNSSVSQRDVREQVERFGLGATLRGIVDKALKEQGADKNPSEIIRSIQKLTNVDPKPPQSKSVASNATTSRNQPRSSAASEAPSPMPTPSHAPPAPRPRRTNSSPSNSVSGNSGPTNELLADFWQAISSTPKAGDGGGGAASGSPTESKSGFSFHVGWRQWCVLGIAAIVCGVLLFLAKKRRSMSAEAAAQQTERVKEILRAGMRSRADVVAAFHRFALQRPHSAASWWTHGFVARKLSETSPQIRTAIEDLALVYEQARYLPADVELSSEQLKRAQSAFQKCVTVDA